MNATAETATVSAAAEYRIRHALARMANLDPRATLQALKPYTSADAWRYAAELCRDPERYGPAAATVERLALQTTPADAAQALDALQMCEARHFYAAADDAITEDPATVLALLAPYCTPQTYGIRWGAARFGLEEMDSSGSLRRLLEALPTAWAMGALHWDATNAIGWTLDAARTMPANDQVPTPES